MNELDRIKTLILNVLDHGDIKDTLDLFLDDQKQPIDQQKIQGCLNSLVSKEVILLK